MATVCFLVLLEVSIILIRMRLSEKLSETVLIPHLLAIYFSVQHAINQHPH